MKLIRRGVIAVVLALLIAPLAAEAQPAGKVYRVALILATSPVAEMAGPEPVHPAARAFVQAMRALGYVEGQNLVLERRSAEGRMERVPDIVAELLRFNADVMVTVGTPMTVGARQATTTVPIVMATSSGPVEAGVVASLGQPGGNVTGFTVDAGPEINGKRLELLRKAVPGISRVAFIGSKGSWEHSYGRAAQDAARALGLTLFLAEHKPTDYAPAFAAATRERADALFASDSPSNFAHRRLIVDFARKSRLPAVYAHREYAEAGGLMAYGASVPDLFRRAAGYVDRILRGAKPAHLPIEQPTKFEIVINLKTAKALGLTIPQPVLLQVDEVLE